MPAKSKRPYLIRALNDWIIDSELTPYLMVDASGDETIDVVNPATETVIARIAAGTTDDVNRAVAAARAAFETWSQSTVEEREQVLSKIIEGYKARSDDLAQAVTEEMGAPAGFARKLQVGAGLGHFVTGAPLAPVTRRGAPGHR